MEELAARLAMAHHVTGRTPAIADAFGAGQSDRAQDTGVGFMDVQLRYHAVVHTALWVVAEHG
jgi:hypothetical protein